jgi:hypothetical protein
MCMKFSSPDSLPKSKTGVMLELEAEKTLI